MPTFAERIHELIEGLVRDGHLIHANVTSELRVVDHANSFYVQREATGKLTHTVEWRGALDRRTTLEELLSDMDKAKVLEFHAHTYSPNRTIVSIVWWANKGL